VKIGSAAPASSKWMQPIFCIRWSISEDQGPTLFFARFFRARARLHFASAFSTSSFETVNILRTALSNRSNSVLPGTCGAGAGFIAHL
jgi:hypothetical protein